ncbi:sulfatase-like hydrolase/transferase [Pseudomonas profundi]|uniref:sulfatase-like hydrolase/transferase n=1 Tax=Pseudomonas profundi TaxID=1981513 RepID=UPI00123B9FC6|nr:sulfatase-like hydrolase/transferase [Pseudomonas profundi]
MTTKLLLQKNSKLRFEFLPKTIMSILLTFAIPNGLLFLLAQWMGVGRDLINLDYSLIVVLVAANIYFLAIPLFLLFLLVDLFNIFGQVYPFVRLNDALYLVRFILYGPGYYRIALVFIGCAALSSVWFMLTWGRVSLSSALFAFNASLVGYMFNVYGEGDDVNRFWRVSNSHIVGSQALYFYEYRSRGFIQSYFIDNKDVLLPAEYSRITEALNDSESLLPEKILFIVNESWGVPLNKDIQKELVAPLKKVSEDRVFEFGDLSFVGATVAAELKELCGLHPIHFNLSKVTVGFEECLPNKMRALGYSTSSFHGAVGLMYDRIHWYPRAGFDKSIFYESRAWEKRCYSFPGACDSELAAYVAEELGQEGKRFVYWLTLNTHSIYDDRDLEVDSFSCESFNISSGEVCRNMKLQAQFFHTVSRMLQDYDLADVEVVVVGDHVPPVSILSEQEESYETGKVGWARVSSATVSQTQDAAVAHR